MFTIIKLSPHFLDHTVYVSLGNSFLFFYILTVFQPVNVMTQAVVSYIVTCKSFADLCACLRHE